MVANRTDDTLGTIGATEFVDFGISNCFLVVSVPTSSETYRTKYRV